MGPPSSNTQKLCRATDRLPSFATYAAQQIYWFCLVCEKFQKEEVNLLYNICKYDQTTITGSNLKFLMESYEKNTIDKLFENRFNISRNVVYPMNENDIWKVSLLEELVEIKSGRKEVELSEKEVEDLIFVISTC